MSFEEQHDWCEQRGISPALFTSISLVLERLSDEELATQYHVAISGRDPRGEAGWETIQSLYSDGENFEPIRPDELDIFRVVAQERLAHREPGGKPCLA